MDSSKNLIGLQETQPPSQQQQHERSSNDASYCHGGDKIFLDVGALDGDTIEVFHRLRPDSKSFKYYAWECNRRNIVGLKRRLQQKLPELSVTVLERAAWTSDTTLQFAARVANAGQIQTNNTTTVSGKAATYEVQALDLSKWIQTNFRKSDFIFLKMDIETTEFQVLPHMFATGAMEYIDEVQLEWHDWNKFRSPERTKQRNELEELFRTNNLIYKYATYDREKYGTKTDWNMVPKYFQSEDFPKPWVDSHYFRRGCESPWDVDLPQDGNA